MPMSVVYLLPSVVRAEDRGYLYSHSLSWGIGSGGVG